VSITVGTTYETLDCPVCGLFFAITEEFEKRRRDDGKGFYCPNGHSMSYGDTVRDQLRREKDRVAMLRSNLDQVRADRAAIERSRAAVRGQLTKVKKRVANGVCPCCNRSFPDLSAHMSTKHPDYVEPA
jgi:hypothetical protein